MSHSLKTETEKQAHKVYAKDIHYLSLVRFLLFAIQTRQDIQFVVDLMAQFSGNLEITHLEVAKYVLKGIADFNLILRCYEENSFDLVR